MGARFGSAALLTCLSLLALGKQLTQHNTITLYYTFNI